MHIAKAPKMHGPYRIAVIVDGKEHVGAYYTQRRMVRVHYAGRSKLTQIGGSERGTATMLLFELVREETKEAR
jgi:hypothetical protein